MDFKSKVQEMKAAQEAQLTEQQQKDERERHTLALGEGFRIIIDDLKQYLEEKGDGTTVKNWPNMATSKDIELLIDQIQSLRDELSTRPTEDKKEQELLTQLLEAIQKLPTEHPEAPEPVEEVTVKNQIDYSQQIKDVLEAVKAIKLEYEPEINVQAAPVHVENDYTGLETRLDMLKTAVEAIKLVVPEHDDNNVIQAVESVKDAINNLKFPVPNYVLPFKSSDGKSTQVILNADGTLPIPATPGTNYKVLIDDTSTAGIVYVGKAAIGTAESSPTWQIKVLDTSAYALQKIWAGGNDLFTKRWDQRASLSYT